MSGNYEGAFFSMEVDGQGIPTNILDATTMFMETSGQPIAVWPNPNSSMTQEQFDKLRELRVRMLMDCDEGEAFEYLDAEHEDDLTAIVDGLLDVIVIAWGTLITYIGPDKAKAAAREVFLSNLAKVLGEGLPIFREDGKVMKPEGWTPPDIAGVLWES